MSPRVENLRRFFLESPPWVVFMASLAMMAVGVLVLSLRLSAHPDLAAAHGLRPARFCLPTAHVSADVAASAAANVSLPAAIDAPRRLADEETSLSGVMQSGQLGLTGSIGAGHNWTLLVTLRPLDAVCTGAVCRWRTCLLLSSDEADFLPDIKQENHCRGNFSTAPVSRLQAGTDPCPESAVSVSLDENFHFFLIPMLHDSAAARLHLLYTSYFLFTALGLSLLCALCRNRHHHPQPPFQLLVLES